MTGPLIPAARPARPAWRHTGEQRLRPSPPPFVFVTLEGVLPVQTLFVSPGNPALTCPGMPLLRTAWYGALRSSRGWVRMDEARYRASELKVWQTVGLSPTEQRVRLPCTGTSIRVQTVGDGEPVLFLHGGPNTGTTWAMLVPHMKGFRAHLVDRPGTGLSDDYVMRGDLASVADRFVGEMLDGLGLERAHVVASSFGGYLALRSAQARCQSSS